MICKAVLFSLVWGGRKQNTTKTYIEDKEFTTKKN